MRLELPVRWTENADDKTAELLDKKAEPIYSYGTLSIDSDDIGAYYDIDDNNTVINDRLGKTYVIAVPFSDFKKIYTEVSGRAIMTIQKRTIKKETPKKDDMDDIFK